MGHSLGERTLKKTEFMLPSGKILYGPRQALGSLYKEFLINDKVFKFYLYKSAPDAFEYKYFGTRNKEIWDINLPSLLYLV